MDNENLIADKDNNEAESGGAACNCKTGCGVCPVALLPKGVWQKISTPPFRKRHPFIFWTLLLVLIGTVCLQFVSITLDDAADTRDQIAFVPIKGPILDVSSTLEWIRQIGHNPAVRGVLVRVDSPGGGAAASQEVYDALSRLSAKMPMAVSMGATAASGGLMVSMAGQRIFANPSTVTGSIGVRMDIPQLQGLMGKIGIGQETLVTAPFKDAISYTHAMTPEDRAYLENVLMNMHDQFVGIVAKGRHMTKEHAATLANGKIYTGEQALALGLIDELGGQEAAHAWLAQKTGVPENRKMLQQEISRKRILERLLGLSKSLGLDFDEFLSGAISPSLPQPAFYF